MNPDRTVALRLVVSPALPDLFGDAPASATDGTTAAPDLTPAGVVASAMAKAATTEAGTAAPASASLRLTWAAIATDCHPAHRTFEEVATGRRVVVEVDAGFTVSSGSTPPAVAVRSASVEFLRLPGMGATGRALVAGTRTGFMSRAAFILAFRPVAATLAFQRDAQRNRRVAPYSLPSGRHLPTPTYP